MPDHPAILSANPFIGETGDLHVYIPEGGGPFPFVIGIHGGAWRNGDQQTYSKLWTKLKPLGLALVLASYRKRHQSPFPAAYDDLVHSLDWLSTNCAKLRLDAGRCVLFGSSAGGHLAMLIGARTTKERLPSPRIRGIVQYCGVMNLVTQYAHDQARGATMTKEFLDGSPEEQSDRYQAASPVAHIHPTMPPVWMAHGRNDGVVPLSQSLEVLEKLRAAGCEVTFHEARGLGHTFREVHYHGEAVEPMELLFERDVLRFMQRTLIPRPLVGGMD